MGSRSKSRSNLALTISLKTGIHVRRLCRLRNKIILQFFSQFQQQELAFSVRLSLVMHIHPVDMSRENKFYLSINFTL